MIRKEYELFQLSAQNSKEILLTLKVDLKMENAPIFYEDFNIVYNIDIKNIILDLTQVRFIDSSGLGVLLKCSKEIGQKDGKMLIFGMKSSLLSVFKLAGLLKIFKVTDKDALEKEFPNLFL